MCDRLHHWSSRLPFYYGWLIVGIAFVTMAIGVTARTAFSQAPAASVTDGVHGLVLHSGWFCE